MTMIYWRGKHFWVGKLKEHPDIMSQGETVEKLEENLRDAYAMMVMDGVPAEHFQKAIDI